MCLAHLYREDFDRYIKIRRKTTKWRRCGKSKDFFNGQLKQGCPKGVKRCKLCGIRNGGKSSKKGKGKNKNKIETTNIYISH